MKKIAIYAGSFDIVTNGHLWMIEQGVKLFDKLIIAIGNNSDKKYMFSQDDRFNFVFDIIHNNIIEYKTVDIKNMNMKLLVKFANYYNVNYILRGVRTVKDYEYERPMKHLNYQLNPNIETVFLIPPKEIEDISSSFVKSFIGYDGWQEIIKEYVPESVYKILLERFDN